MNFSIEYLTNIKNNILKYYKCDIIDYDFEPYFYINAKDIGKILNIKNINTTMSKYNNNEKILIKTYTNGGDQRINYLTFDGLFRLISKCRKPEVIDFCISIGINIHTKIFTAIEVDTLKSIMETFNNEKIILQYKVNEYKIDLYFEEKKIAIECDEEHHNIVDDKNREEIIKKELNCKFIRYKPYDKNFNIFKLLNEIYINIK